LLGTLAGCTSGPLGQVAKPTVASKTPEMERSFQQGERYFYARKFADAKNSYTIYIKQFPYNTLTPKAFFRLGEINFQQGDPRRAISLYRKSLEVGVNPEWGGYALYKMAVCYSKLDETSYVFKTLDRMPPDLGDSKLLMRSGSLRVMTAKKSNDHLEEIKGYLELIDAYEGAPANETQSSDVGWIVSGNKAKEEIRRWIESDDKEEIPPLEKMWERFEKKSSGSYLDWKIARLYDQKGDYQNASLWANRYLQIYPKEEYAAAARLMASDLAKRAEVHPVAPVAMASPATSSSPVIGVLLPLTGKYAVYGESVLHGLECAAGIFAPCKNDLGMTLLIRDTEGDSKTSARLVKEFADNRDVRAIIGPLPQVEVDEAVVVAEHEKIPLIALSQKADVAKKGDFVFRNFLTVSDQVATLVDYACGEKRWKTFAILYPQGPAGEEYRKAFVEEVDRCGGRVVASAGYPDSAKNFIDPVRQLKFSETPFDAIFMPDVYRRVPELTAALKFNQIENVHLLGGAGWDHPSLATRGGEEVQGAIFVDGFFLKSSNFATRDFVAMFQEAYGVEPTLLEAYAFDTLKLLGNVLVAHPTYGREEIQQALAAEKNYAGVTGTISFDSEGDARRKLFLLTVDQGDIREVR
jgi:ABC-type branched-subunit amino acid transport system substrate-binding protein